MNMTINFNNQELTVRQNDNGLYSLNDVHKASGQDGQLRDLLRHLTDKQISRFDLSKIKGRKENGAGTYANKHAVLWLAAKLDEDFEWAVIDTFNALTEGRTEDALTIAQSVCKVDVVRNLIIGTNYIKKDSQKLVDAIIKQSIEMGDFMGWSQPQIETEIKTRLFNAGIQFKQRAYEETKRKLSSKYDALCVAKKATERSLKEQGSW
ncbi:KilA-N domain-containing protein [Vibrio aestuarianus]|uniref:KilA-N domain-containing protein n=1 Tax=Vibrio aestuarianus TaxID=28171 RepID=UPI00406990A8